MDTDLKSPRIEGYVELADGKIAPIVSVDNLEEITVLVDQIEALLTTLNGYVDGLETIGNTINSNVDQLEAISTSISNYTKTPSVIGDGTKTVTTAATRVKLIEAVTTCKKVVITAKDDNAGTIVVGGETVVALAGVTRQGTPLLASESVIIEIDDVSKVYIDSTTNGEGVTYTYVA